MEGWTGRQKKGEKKSGASLKKKIWREKKKKKETLAC